MTNHERAFLAQIALGWFSVDHQGRIWRHISFIGGGAESMKWIDPPTRAERSVSKRGGYIRVMFRDGQKRRKVAAHRIVWMVVNKATIPEPLEINHKDGIKSNNTPNNLEAITRPMNVVHAIHVLGRKSRNGEANGAALLTAEQVLQIRALHRKMTQRKIGEIFGVKQTTINNILYRHSWKHLP